MVRAGVDDPDAAFTHKGGDPGGVPRRKAHRESPVAARGRGYWAPVRFGILDEGQEAAQEGVGRQVRLLRSVYCGRRAWRRGALSSEEPLLVARLLLR